MSYIDDYRFLKKIYNQDENVIPIPGSDLYIENHRFVSSDSPLIKYKTLNKECSLFPPSAPFTTNLAKIDDSELKENTSFIFSIFKKKHQSEDVILLLHGLNERNWDKYLPWAKKLVEKTGKSVILFPISFHMNRAPELWSNPRLMNKICRERAEIYSDKESTSFVNAALSTRLEYRPQRFFRSGLKTIYDIIKLIGKIKSGEQNGINKNAKIDLFGYSIGAFIAEILFIANPLDYFADSRLFLFCGGPVFDKMKPVSRYIIDKKANESLRKYYIDDFYYYVDEDESLKWFFRKSNKIAKAFAGMLNLRWMKNFREQRLKEMSAKIVSLSLAKDYVMPFKAVEETLNGTFNSRHINTVVEDFPYEYDHVNPFPPIDKIAELVDESFEKIFDIASCSLT